MRVKYLVDANVLSEPTKTEAEPSVIHWLREHEGQLAVNPIVLGEIEYGILLLPPGRKRNRLRQWFADGVQRLRVLDIDGATGTAWARLLARLKAAGRAMPVKDSLVAASALVHDLTVATRNVSDYQHAGVRLVDPFPPRRGPDSSVRG